jgi:hypothetical protein
VLLQTPKIRRCTPTDLTDFDSVPSWMLYKLSKKQEETTRSLEKIERGMSHITQSLQITDPSLLRYSIETGGIWRPTGDLEADGETSFGL